MATEATSYIHSAVDGALTRAFDDIEAYVSAGRCTYDVVTQALRRGWDEAVADAWLDYLGEEV